MPSRALRTAAALLAVGGALALAAGQSGEAPKPLTLEQVSLVRAWVDQGAK